MARLSGFLENYEEGTHVIVVNEENETILNDQKGWAFYSQRMAILRHAHVMDYKDFKSNLYVNGKRMRGVKVVVGTHES